jgi:hypothetical protein
MANTYNLIASSTVVTPANAVTFSSIPQTYTDLKLVFSTRSSDGSGAGQEVEVAINAITSGYSSKMFYSNNGTSALAASASSNPFYTWGGGMSSSSATASTFGNSEMYFVNYTNSTAKTALTSSVTENAGVASFNNVATHVNTTTAPITSITLYAWQSFINFVAGSTFYLYGIKNS